MLVQFSVKNFMSFDTEQVLSMVATESDPQHPSHLVPGEAHKGGTALRAAALYGPNASGKSNLVKAIGLARDLIVNGRRGEQATGMRPFRLGTKQADKFSKFEFVVRTQDKLYNYGFRLSARRVEEEWLYATLNKREVVLFQRTTADDGKVNVEPGPEMRGKTKEQAQFLQFIAQGMKPNQLFLTEAAERNVATVKPLMDWFQNALVLIEAEPRAEGLEIIAHEDNTLTGFLSSVLQAAGTGISAVETEEVPFILARGIPDIPEEQREDLLNKLSKADDNAIAQVEVSDGRRYFLQKKADGEITSIRLRMQHQTEQSRPVYFTMDEESDGTQRLIHLIPALRMLKNAPEKTVILDELDRRFHPHLSRLFLQAALDCDPQHTQSQLIFTTHDTNLLDLDLLRRDEIWFVEKDARGASSLYSLAEFKVRPDLQIEKGYLNGRFGAIPFISDINHLGWTAGPNQEQDQDSNNETAAPAGSKA